MIPLLLALALPPKAPAALAPETVLARYTSALAAAHDPRVFAFEYTLEQGGVRSREQQHRVFRSGSDERDETLAVDGKTLVPPQVRIFRARRYRYTLAALAPRTDTYAFTYAGTRREGHHLDYVFRLTPHAPGAFTFTDVQVDGVTFLPRRVGFATRANDGRGSVAFGKIDRWWVVQTVRAQANVPAGVATERLAFMHYRFPASLPPSTFAVPRPLPSATLSPP